MSRIWRGGALTSPLTLVLAAMGAAFLALGDRRDGLVIWLTAVALVLAESRLGGGLERASRALSRLSAPRVQAWRDGRLLELAAGDLELGDAVVLSPGTRVPQDLTLIEGERLIVDESLVTGESQPVRRSAGSPGAAELPAGARVLRGSGLARVAAVGAASTLGRIQALAEAPEAAAGGARPEAARLGRQLLIAAAAVTALVAAAALVHGQPPRDALLGVLTVAFAALPPELPALVTAILTLAALALAEQGALVRRPGATEALAGMTLVCTDKTGTLTENRITLTQTLPALTVLEGLEEGHAAEDWVRQVARLASEPPIGRAGFGDPLEVAAWRASGHEWPAPLARFGFDASRRLASALVAVEGSLLLGVKGAPEAVLVRCTAWRARAGAEPLDPDLRSLALVRAGALAASGTRVLAVATRRLAGEPPRAPSGVERELTFEGLIGFSDPLRPEVPEAVRQLSQQGVTVTMVTGDHVETAESVARQAGLWGPVFLAAQTRGWSERELGERTARGCVIARALPEDKLRAVRAATAAGEVVAATGDGVNDVPALRAAAVGVAMGQGGSQAAREAAGLVLADNSLATLAGSATRSRRLVAELRRAVRYWLALKLGLVGVLVAAALAGQPLPLGPVQVVGLDALMAAGAATMLARPGARALAGSRDGGRPGLLAGRAGVRVLAGGVTLAGLGALPYLGSLPLVGVGAARALGIACWLVAGTALGAAMTLPSGGRSPGRADPWGLAAASAATGIAAAALLLPGLASRFAGAPLPPAIALPALALSLLGPWWPVVINRLGVW